MLRLTIRTLRAQLVRLVLSSLAILLGVGFIAGTLIFSDGLRQGEIAAADQFDRNTDVKVIYTGNEDGRLSSDLVAKIRGIDGVTAAEGIVNTSIGVYDRNNKIMRGSNAYAQSIPADPSLNSYEVRSGALPKQSGEVVIDTATAKKQGWKVSDKVKVGVEPWWQTLTVVGIVDVAGSELDHGGPFIGLSTPDATAATAGAGAADIVVRTRPGTSHDAVADQIRQVVKAAGLADANIKVKTHAEIRRDALAIAGQDADSFEQALLMFALVAVCVAAFVIANTFAIVLAQRSREIALLRLVGAVRPQIFRSVLIESTLIGLTASAAGVLFGFGIAGGLRALFTALGDELPGSVRLSPMTVVISMLVGVVVTVGASLLPAWRATRIAPIAALTDAATSQGRKAGLVRVIFGLLVLGFGVAILFTATSSKNILFLGAGGIICFLGIVLLGPRLVPALINLIGLPLAKLTGANTKLATMNAVRNPRRVAATAVALIIGVSLVSSLAIVIESAKVGTAERVDSKFGSDFTLISEDPNKDLPAGFIDALHREKSFGIVAFYYTKEYSDGEFTKISSDDPRLLGKTTKAQAGDIAALTSGTAIVSVQSGKHVGDTITLQGKSLRVVATVKSGDTDLTDERFALVTESDMLAMYPDAKVRFGQISLANGVSIDQGKATLERMLDPYPTVNYFDKAGLKKLYTKSLDMVLGVMVGLLGLAVIIALVGVANTLSLSVFERTRENALLRAIGLTRGRLRAVLAIEAALMAVAAGLIGLALGAGVSRATVSLLSGLEGGSGMPFILPGTRLLVLIAVAAAAALLASVMPARGAVRRPIVESLAAE